MYKFKLRLLIISIIGMVIFIPYSVAQEPSSPPTDDSQDTHHDHYHEGALRRFEIITLSALPFTAIHSYLGVRTVRMIQENKIAPVLTPKNYRVMGISAVSLSLFIGIWDWMHTRKVDRSAPSIPEHKKPDPPTEEGTPPEGPIAFSPSNAQHANLNRTSMFIGDVQHWSDDHQLNMWNTDQTEFVAIPLLQIRF